MQVVDVLANMPHFARATVQREDFKPTVSQIYKMDSREAMQNLRSYALYISVLGDRTCVPKEVIGKGEN